MTDQPKPQQPAARLVDQGRSEGYQVGSAQGEIRLDGMAKGTAAAVDALAGRLAVVTENMAMVIAGLRAENAALEKALAEKTAEASKLAAELAEVKNELLDVDKALASGSDEGRSHVDSVTATTRLIPT